MEEFDFKLECTCGVETSGYFASDDKVERLHCTCGLIWEIIRPIITK